MKDAMLFSSFPRASSFLGWSEWPDAIYQKMSGFVRFLYIQKFHFFPRFLGVRSGFDALLCKFLKFSQVPFLSNMAAGVLFALLGARKSRINKLCL